MADAQDSEHIGHEVASARPQSRLKTNIFISDTVEAYQDPTITKRWPFDWARKPDYLIL